MQQVWDVDRGEIREVSDSEVVAGMIRYARLLGAGTPACGVYERHALELTASAQNKEG
jgi:hypothetical protein